MSPDDETEDEAESSAADRQREPQRVIDADADVAVDPAEGATADAETDDADGGSTVAPTTDDDSATTDEDSVTTDDDSAGTDEEPASDTERAETQTRADPNDSNEPAMRSGDGPLLGYGGWTLLMLFLQIVVTVALVGVTAQSLPAVDAPLVPPGVPSYVYVYAGVGAVGYTFTRAVTVDVTTERIGDWTVRIFAALPLAAATYLLATIAVAGGTEELTRRQLALVALLTGLFVNTAYARLDAAAERLLGPSR
mgnify:CR=1 FL=1